MPREYSQKAALVTGGAHGIGKATAALLTERGYRVAIADRDAEAYAASKGGMVALTHALAISLGPQVRVNCISPALVARKTSPSWSRFYSPMLQASPPARTTCWTVA